MIKISVFLIIILATVVLAPPPPPPTPTFFDTEVVDDSPFGSEITLGSLPTDDLNALEHRISVLENKETSNWLLFLISLNIVLIALLLYVIKLHHGRKHHGG
jgi:hypothetical protein